MHNVAYYITPWNTVLISVLFNQQNCGDKHLKGQSHKSHTQKNSDTINKVFSFFRGGGGWLKASASLCAWGRHMSISGQSLQGKGEGFFTRLGRRRLTLLGLVLQYCHGMLELWGESHTHTLTLVLDSCSLCVCVYKAKTQLALMARGQGLYIMDETERERALNPYTLI